MDQTSSPQPANFEFVQCSFLAVRLRGQNAYVVGAAVASLTDQLRRMGWQPDPRDPNQRALQFNGVVLDVEANLSMLASGGVDSAQWYEFCTRSGIAAVPVALPVAFVPVQGEPRSRSVMVVLAALLVAAALVYLLDSDRNSDANDHLAGHRGIEGQTEIPVDGKSDLPGNPVSVTYKIAPHEFEVVDRTEPDPTFTPPILGGDSWSLDKWAQTGRDYIDLAYIGVGESFDDPKVRKQWLATVNADVAEDAGQPVTPTKVSADGHNGYQWEYMSREGWWYRFVRFPVGDHIVRLSCRAMPESNNADFHQRCTDIGATLKINVKA